MTDDRPRIEYASWVRREEFPEVIKSMIKLQTEAPVQGADAALKDGIRREREQLQRFYSAGLFAYTGDREGWSRDIRQVMRDAPNNPYYQWFTGGAR